MEFKIGNHVFSNILISTLIKLGKKRKLDPMLMGSFEILLILGTLTLKIDFHPSLEKIGIIFYVLVFEKDIDDHIRVK